MMATEVSGSSDRQSGLDASISIAVSRRELAAVFFWTVLADLLIFRTSGYGGPALFLALVPILFWMRHGGLTQGPARIFVTALVFAVALRLAWSGSVGAMVAGSVLIIALAMSASGCVPYVMEGCLLASRVFYDGLRRIISYPLPAGVHRAVHSRGRGLAVVLPIVAAAAFSAIFVVANPNLFELVWTELSRISQQVELWIQSLSLWELPFCICALLIGAALMRPMLPVKPIGSSENKQLILEAESPMYAAYRNMLWTLIILFAAYLCFEFTTLWRRDFPEGFYYAGYAHQGAAWLTFALALATAVLSVIFGGSMRRDPRRIRMRMLAWVWSGLNLLLAAAVYNRLMIYVGYNGMTRMRMVGFFGITTVVIGFLLVLVKIRSDRGFWWLIRSQLLALVATMIVYAITPVDYLISRYNVSTVRAGYLPPAVMIAVKPTGDEGVLPLLELSDCGDPIIRSGVLAMLAARQQSLESVPIENWSEYQGVTEILRGRLRQKQAAWADFQDGDDQRRAIESFQDYAMQWY